MSFFKLPGQIFKKFPGALFCWCFLVCLDSILGAFAVLSIVPLTNYFIDPTFANPSKIIDITKRIFSHLDIPMAYWSLGACFVAANIGKGAASICVRYFTLKIKYSIIQSILNDVTTDIWRARWEFFGNTKSGSVLNILTKEVSNMGDAIGHLVTMVSNAIQFIVFISVPLILNATLTLTTGFFAVLLGIPFLALKNKTYEYVQKNIETSGQTMEVLSESFSAAKIILGFARQNESQRRFMDSYFDYSNISIKSQALASIVPNLYRPIGILAGIIALGISIHFQGHEQIVELAAIMWSLISAVTILSNVFQGQLDIKAFEAAYEQMELLRKSAVQVKERQGGLPFESFKRNLDFNHVEFSYPNRDATLKEISFRIERGQKIAFVGESGAGKSTLIDLLLGLQLPSSGKILLDGIDLNSIDLNQYRNKIGYVPQDPILFRGTIADNLLWSNSDLNEGLIWEALTAADAVDFVKSFPDGILTNVGDRGTKLSGGQRQRIALARAIIRKPDILILDEATSALDRESENSISRSISAINRNTTVILISHKLASIVQADKIFVVSDGKIVQSGTYAELSQSVTGPFHKLFGNSKRD